MEQVWQVRGDLRRLFDHEESFNRYIRCLTAFLSGSLSHEEMTAILGNLLTSTEAIRKTCKSKY